MPRGGPRGAMRGGAPRGAMGRGNAPRGGPSGRGGPPAPAANRGGATNRSRPPAAGAPRMLPAAALSHQQVPSASQPKAEAYEDYVRFNAVHVHFFRPHHIVGSDPLVAFDPRLPMKSHTQNLHTRDMKATTVSKQHLRKRS